MLVVPKAGHVPPGRFVCGDLLGTPAELVRTTERYIDEREPAWAQLEEPAPARPADGAQVQHDVDTWWTTVSADSARPRFRPASISGEAHSAPRNETEEATATPRKPRAGRLGALFGTTVHHAIGLALSGASPRDAVEHAAKHTGLAEHLDEACADVDRALAALKAENLLRPLGSELQIEYPVAGAWNDGVLLSGYIDLVAAPDGRLDVVDFKTDAPPDCPVEEAYPEYANQVRTYGRLLCAAEVTGNRSLRCGLLFTADGLLRWLA